MGGALGFIGSIPFYEPSLSIVTTFAGMAVGLSVEWAIHNYQTSDLIHRETVERVNRWLVELGQPGLGIKYGLLQPQPVSQILFSKGDAVLVDETVRTHLQTPTATLRRRCADPKSD